MVLDVDGITVHIEKKGAGPPLLLIHGLGSPLVWDRLSDPLAKDFTVLAVDLPGFGESDLPPTPYSTQHYADCIAALLERLQLQRVIILGVSYGGQIASTFTFHHPQRVEKLILVCSTGLGTGSSFLSLSPVWNIASFTAKYFALANRRCIRWLSRNSFYDITKRPADLADRFYQSLSRTGRREAWLNCARNVLRTDKQFSTQLSTILVPTLILWGKEDRIVPVRWANEFHRRLPTSTLTVLEGCGHSLLLEKPDEVVHAIRMWVGNQ